MPLRTLKVIESYFDGGEFNEVGCFHRIPGVDEMDKKGHEQRGFEGLKNGE